VAYQSFPWQAGSSRSFDKLAVLYLPMLKGKSVLDVGCNTGFFCGYAAFQGAVRVRGIDSNPSFIEQAKQWFEECSFECMSWEDLDAEKYDLILCLSAIHYAGDQQRLLDMLMSRLKPGGLLVLELGLAPGEADEFVPIKRSIDTRLFPTKAKLHSMFAPYAAKYICPSVEQAGDPLPRHVYHVYNALPLAILFMDGHYAGKTSTVASIIKPDFKRLSGDVIFHQIFQKSLNAPPELAALVRPVTGTDHIDSAALIGTICEAGLLPQLAAIYVQLAEGKSFVLDAYIPEAYQGDMAVALSDAGFFLVDVHVHGSADYAWTRQRTPFSCCEAYMDNLMTRNRIDEKAYLAANPDVAKAVAEGKMPSATVHYWHFGKRENRKLKP
jgi:SAM-dependent methyltransferase